jgi:hypothetical protein
MPSSPELLQILAGVIRAEMLLASDQVVIYNQRWVIPNDERLYVSLNVMGSRPYANNRRMVSSFASNPLGGAGIAVLNEEQQVSSADLISLHVQSYGDQARVRRNEVMFALNSTRCEQQMERWGFHVGPLPSSFADCSEGLGTAMLTKYAITFSVLSAQARVNPVDYYDQFPIGQLAIQP